MTKIKVRLNAASAPFAAVEKVNGRRTDFLFHLTAEHPGPIELNLKDITKYAAMMIIANAASGRIFLEDTEKTINLLRSIANPKAKDVKAEIKEKLTVKTENNEIDYDTIVSLSILKIKKEIDSLKESNSLTEEVLNKLIDKEMEKETPRVSLLEYFKDLLTSFNKQEEDVKDDIIEDKQEKPDSE